MFAGKSRAYPNEAPLRLAPGLTHKHYTRLERLARIKHSSLLRKFVYYDRKKFYKIEPRLQEIGVTMSTANMMAPHAVPEQNQNKNVPITKPSTWSEQRHQLVIFIIGFLNLFSA
jgi:hypothetical protein